MPEAAVNVVPLNRTTDKYVCISTVVSFLLKYKMVLDCFYSQILRTTATVAMITDQITLLKLHPCSNKHDVLLYVI